MERILAFLSSSNWAYIVPAAIVLALFYFLKRATRYRPRRYPYYSSSIQRIMDQERLLRMRHFGLEEENEAAPSAVKKLLLRDDVTLRILEEVHEPRNMRRRLLAGSHDSLRLHVLDSLETELKSFLRESVDSESFTGIRDRTLCILDEVRIEKDKLQQSEPFNDIVDPEKSLLIDIFSQIDPTNVIVRQKAVQLSNIIKIKHQDLLKLQAENATAGTWTRWGVAGTIVFGVISLVLSFISIRSAGPGA